MTWSHPETLYLVSTNILRIKEDNENSDPVNNSWMYLKLVPESKKNLAEISQHQYRNL